MCQERLARFLIHPCRALSAWPHRQPPESIVFAFPQLGRLMCRTTRANGLLAFDRGRVPASGTWSKARSIWLTHMIPRRGASLRSEAHSFFRLPLFPRLRRALIVVCPAEVLSLSSLWVT